jgi:hypothetical protein
VKKLVLFSLAIAVCASGFGAANGTLVKQISPARGASIAAGSTVHVAWKINSLTGSWCEQEVFLSTDGGKTYTRQISPALNTSARSFEWNVPSNLSGLVMLDIRYGCEMGRNLEVRNPQTGMAFHIIGSGSVPPSK